MIHHHQQQQMHQLNVSQPPPSHAVNPQSAQGRMSHHHQQRISHQHIQQQQLPPIHSSRQSINQPPSQHLHHNGVIINNINGQQAQHQHQIPPPPVLTKPHLHQNIATLNQKPPIHLNSIHTIPQRLLQCFEKPPSNNFKRENTINVSASATLSNNPSIVSVTHSTQHHTKYRSNITNEPVHTIKQQERVMEIKSSNNNSSTSSKDLSTNVGNSNITTETNIILSNNPDDPVSSNAGSSTTNNTEKGLESLASTKEKTPMCLVNELARYNKLQHQYRLIGEQGPAHKKRFTVILKLGEQEEYASEGLSIKKAQHSAAKDAILKTAYKHPPLKINRQIKGFNNINKLNSGNITPTVELNALAMKRGEPTVYTLETVLSNQQQQVAQQQGASYGNYNRNNAYQSRKFGNNRGTDRVGSSQYGGGRFNNNYGNHLKFNYSNRIENIEMDDVATGESFSITLQVGNRTFSGMGPTQQAARHDAAARALEVLRPLTNENNSFSKSLISATSSNADESENGDDSIINSDIKSPISIVHELALKRKLSVGFDVQSEKGPPHMKTYVTLCKVGTIVTEGEGNGKKLSKKKSAEKMMEELKKLPPLSPVDEPANRAILRVRRKQHQVVMKKKSRNLIKEKIEQATSEDINPISQLIQIQQARKEKEPTYTVVDERGSARRREFVIEVSAGGITASGTGPNKKLAKKIAAENLLILMGSGTTILLSDVEQNDTKKCTEAEKSKKVSFIDTELTVEKSIQKHQPTGSAGRQIVPGLLLVTSPSDGFSTPSKKEASEYGIHTESDLKTNVNDKPPISEKLVTSPSNSVASNNDSGICEAGGVSPRDQLNYLAQLIGFQVSYSDFPKGNHTEFLSLATLSTDPPQMAHGSGHNIDESRDQAASKALSVLSEMGLDNVKPKQTLHAKK